MKLLIVGSGGREHAICWKLKKDDPSVELFCAPGNAGTEELAQNLPVDASDVAGLTDWAVKNRPDMVIVGPEAPLCLGLVDTLAEHGIPAFGPTGHAAQIEGSKYFAKEIMQAANVPTAEWRLVESLDEARSAVEEFGLPVVLKADGLAAGKGVLVCSSTKELEEGLKALFTERTFGSASDKVIVEEFLEGEEVTLLAFVDGASVIPMVSSQDHKRLCNGDEGPNTGGMGAYSPAPAISPEMRDIVLNRIFRPVVAELATRGIDYRGVLYAGLMLTPNGPRVLEFNCRFGDPETQCILPRMASSLLPVLQACVDGRLKPEMVSWSPDACVCVVMVSGGYPGSYEKGAEITGLEDALTFDNVAVFHAGTTRCQDTVCVNGGRVLGITATGADIAEAVKTAYHALLRIKFDHAQYRTDIAARALKNSLTKG